MTDTDTDSDSDGCGFRQNVVNLTHGVVNLTHHVSMYHTMCQCTSPCVNVPHYVSMYLTMCQVYHTMCQCTSPCVNVPHHVSMYHTMCQVYHTMCQVYHTMCQVYLTMCQVYSGWSHRRLHRRDFLPHVITQKRFASGVLFLVRGYIWWMSPPSSNFCLGLQQIGQCRPLKGQNLDIWLHFGPFLKYSEADSLGDHVHNVYIYVWYKPAKLKPSASYFKGQGWP